MLFYESLKRSLLNAEELKFKITIKIILQIKAKVIRKTFRDDAFLAFEPVLGSEDFSYYLKEKVGAFINVGMQSEKSQYPHHHQKFDIDEESIPAVIELMTQLALNT